MSPLHRSHAGENNNHDGSELHLRSQLKRGSAVFFLSVPILLLLTQQSAGAQLTTPLFNQTSNVTSTLPPSNATKPGPTAAAPDATRLKVDVVLFGISNDTGNIVTFVTAKNITKAFAGNAQSLDRADNHTDGIAEVFVSFPEFKAKVGDQFQACNLVVKDLTHTCTSGLKSPANKTETAQLLIGSPTSSTTKK